MAKLTSEDFEKLISGWLSNPDLKKGVEAYASYAEDDIPEEEWGTKSQEELNALIWNIWCDGSQWELQEKTILGEEYDYYFEYHTPEAAEQFNRFYPNCDPIISGWSFNLDHCGGYNQDILNKVCSEHSIPPKCWVRSFEPKGSLGNNFRLECVSTPEDNEVVGWVVIVD